jgi:hypothetical protein
MMVYPLHLLNIEQPETKALLENSFHRALATVGPGQRQAMVQTHAAPIGAATIILDMLLQSWSDPAKEGPDPVRIEGDAEATLQEISPGIYQIHLGKGRDVLLVPRG